MSKTNLNIVGLIPARMASTRFPNKPMAKIAGIPMIGHVYLRCAMSELLDDLYVATCDKEIYEYIESIGGKAVMTKDTHERASDRCAEALQKIEAKTGKKADIMVMIQGDEPMIRPQMIDEAIQPLLEENEYVISNLMTEIKTKEEQANPNRVKVVVDKDNCAMYYSREPIPSWKKGATSVPMLNQTGIILFRRDFLFKYMEMEQTPLEIVESVDMLRVLENGYKIKMVLTEDTTVGVDTPDDLDMASKAMEKDILYPKYADKKQG